MKKAFVLLIMCLAFPLSVFAGGTTKTDVIIDGGIESMMLQMPSK